MPEILSFVEAEDIQLFEYDAQDGLPKDITSTPAIIYRNGKGESVYAGRYTSISTIKNFIRSARVIPQTASTLDKEDIPVYNSGRMQIATSIKITGPQYLNDSDSESSDHKNLLALAYEGIKKGMKDFKFEKLVQLKRTDRIFYLDFHPYFVNPDSLILSFELYSQFSCIDPIYTSIDQKIMGTNISTAFTQAANILKKEIFQSLSASQIGDAYSAVDKGNSIKELIEFDIPIIESASRIYSKVDPYKSLPKQWKFKSAIGNKLPILQFNFMEPLSRYVGEITSIDGTIQLNNSNNLINGVFEATMNSLTMGEESFDKKVLKEYVKARSNPKSTFTTEQIVNQESLAWSQTTTLSINGTMELMKKSRPITITASLTPYVNEDGGEEMLIQANWSMNITDGWNIKGPDGPDPAKKTLEFSMNILMQPIQ